MISCRFQRLSLILALCPVLVTNAWVMLPRPSQHDQSSRSTCSSAKRRPQSRRDAAATETTTRDGAKEEKRLLHMYNSKSRTKEALHPMRPDGVVTMYTCGPTVYDAAHVGNFRAFLTYDVVKRVLQYFGYTVEHVCNLTDVDDKILQRAADRKLATVRTLTDEYCQVFFQDLAALNIVPATHYPRATDHVDAMMNMVAKLADKGLAYETADGSWYFRTQSQAGYGQQLVQLNYDEMESQGESSSAAGTPASSGEEEEVEIEKEHFADFCLWKAFKEGQDRDDMAWESSRIQKGRPGWHLECSAMADRFFPDYTIDLHGGGIDLKFPHHENEIAQSEGATDRTFCQCWFHNGFVNLDNEKMSKSLGNFLTLRQACPSSIDVRAYRYLVVSSQYRNPMAFSPEVVQQAVNALGRIDKVRAELTSILNDAAAVETNSPTSSSSSVIAKKTVPAALANFETALLDDLSMPRAAAALFSLVKAAEKECKKIRNAPAEETVDAVGLQALVDAMEKMDQVFGVFYTVPGCEEETDANDDVSADDSIPEAVVELSAARTAAKVAKDWDTADALRGQITELGFAVKDVKGGEAVITRIS